MLKVDSLYLGSLGGECTLKYVYQHTQKDKLKDRDGKARTVDLKKKIYIYDLRGSKQKSLFKNCLIIELNIKNLLDKLCRELRGRNHPNVTQELTCN